MEDSLITKIVKRLEDKGFSVTIDKNSVYRASGYNKRVAVKCNYCGDVSDREVEKLKVGMFFCYECMRIKMRRNLDEKGFIATDLSKEPYKIECKKCGTCKSVSQEMARNSCGIDCEGCRNKAYEESCEYLNLRFLYTVRSKNKITVKFKCKCCGLFDERSSSQILSREFSCNGCRVNRYSEILKKKNCEFIKEVGKTKKRIVYRTPTGKIMECWLSVLIALSFRLDDNPVNEREHSVYLLCVRHSGNLYYKIGVAHNIESRIKSLKLDGLEYSKTLGVFESRETAVAYETKLHKVVSEYSLDRCVAREFSKATRKGRSKKTENYWSDGETEWFTADALTVLQKESIL